MIGQLCRVLFDQDKKPCLFSQIVARHIGLASFLSVTLLVLYQLQTAQTPLHAAV